MRLKDYLLDSAAHKKGRWGGEGGKAKLKNIISNKWHFIRWKPESSFTKDWPPQSQLYNVVVWGREVVVKKKGVIGLVKIVFHRAIKHYTIEKVVN